MLKCRGSSNRFKNSPLVVSNTSFTAWPLVHPVTLMSDNLSLDLISLLFFTSSELQMTSDARPELSSVSLPIHSIEELIIYKRAKNRYHLVRLVTDKEAINKTAAAERGDWHWSLVVGIGNIISDSKPIISVIPIEERRQSLMGLGPVNSNYSFRMRAFLVLNRYVSISNSLVLL